MRPQTPTAAIPNLILLLLTLTTTSFAVTSGGVNYSQTNAISDAWIKDWIAKNDINILYDSSEYDSRRISRDAIKPNSPNIVRFCDWRTTFQNDAYNGLAPSQSGARWSNPPQPDWGRCRNYTNVVPDKGKMSQCYNFGMDNSPMMGIWGSKGLQCELFFDDWCRNYILDPNVAPGKDRQRIWFDSALLVTKDNDWGFDNMDDKHDKWKTMGFEKTLYKKYGPKSMRCWMPGQVVGLGVKRGEEEGEGMVMGSDEEREAWAERQAGVEVGEEFDAGFA
ncbi:uncharacterized protein AB675_12053 [Cyphellophora attinorum]|uniref:Uncharacterized protein n=1 Tax=Cyphellophora attinorum TaxID=1664694 RepID=A0A0N1H8P7_9EURO|nr:uncharacterized protein AB675_12053 [Phialophora attinorum]KPI38346.1 hypothetical protein AB675_12053 [Phialophora attinorum]